MQRTHHRNCIALNCDLKIKAVFNFSVYALLKFHCLLQDILSHYVSPFQPLVFLIHFEGLVSKLLGSFSTKWEATFQLVLKK